VIYFVVLAPLITIPLGGGMGVWLAFRRAKARGYLRTVDELKVMQKLGEQIESPGY